LTGDTRALDSPTPLRVTSGNMPQDRVLPPEVKAEILRLVGDLK
jgi:hypothetical protein